MQSDAEGAPSFAIDTYDKGKAPGWGPEGVAPSPSEAGIVVLYRVQNDKINKAWAMADNEGVATLGDMPEDKFKESAAFTQAVDHVFRPGGLTGTATPLPRRRAGLLSRASRASWARAYAPAASPPPPPSPLPSNPRPAACLPHNRTSRWRVSATLTGVFVCACVHVCMCAGWGSCPRHGQAAPSPCTTTTTTRSR